MMTPGFRLDNSRVQSDHGYDVMTWLIGIGRDWRPLPGVVPPHDPHGEGRATS